MSNKEQVPAPVLPKGFPPELIPVYDWWVKEGKSTLAMVAAAVVVVASFYGVKDYMQKRNVAANAALESAVNVTDFEAAAADYGSTKLGGAIDLRLAKSYFDEGRYEDALKIYEKLSKKGVTSFEDVALVGRAYALEGLKRYEEAGKAFAEYVESSSTNAYLLLTAKLGAARVQALAGDKDGAVKTLEALAKESESDGMAKMRVERLIDMIKRYDPARPARTLFDQADAAEAAIEAEKKTEVKAEVKADAK